MCGQIRTDQMMASMYRYVKVEGVCRLKMTSATFGQTKLTLAKADFYFLNSFFEMGHSPV